MPERIDIGTEELNQLLERARERLSAEDYRKLKAAVDTLEYLTELVADKDTTIRHLRQLLLPAGTEKTKDVLAQVGVPLSSGRAERKPAGSPEQPQADPARGHGRNGAEAFTGARQVQISHPKLKHGDRCPECGQGNVYGQKDRKVLVRIVGQAPLAATVYWLERLRCGACGLIFTAQEPEGVGPEKFDETAAAMIAQLKYGSGTPFYRLEQLERHLGIPLPAATQWEIVEEAAEVIKPARDELVRQAAQGDVVHNDDTGMRVLRLLRDPSDERTGVFTSGIVATGQGRQIAVYFTGPKHAGENLADMLKRRSAQLGPVIQMCDALSSQRAEAACRSGDSVGELPGPWTQADRSRSGELSGAMPSRAGELGRGVWPRRRSPPARLEARRTATVSSGAQRPRDGEPISVAGSPVRRAQDRAQLRPGQGHHLSAAALEGTDSVFAKSGSSARQQPRRESLEAGGATPEKRIVLSNPPRGTGRRSVHDPDSHRRTVRRQLVRLSDGVAAPRSGVDRPPRGVDALELPRHDGTDRLV